jgi:hypothetical protein
LHLTCCAHILQHATLFHATAALFVAQWSNVDLTEAPLLYDWRQKELYVCRLFTVLVLILTRVTDLLEGFLRC